MCRPARSAALVAGLPIALFCLSGCASYGDFTLPVPDTAGAADWSTAQWIPEPAPVLTREEVSDVLNPSVIRFGESYLNLYSEFDGTAWHTAVAESSDGVAWAKRGRVLSPEGQEGSYIAANGSALNRDGELYYWYQITAPATPRLDSRSQPPRIALARSTDGITWTRHGGEPVLPLGPRGSFDELGVADPYVIEAEGMLYMFYLGQDRARRQRLGLARSADGVAWEKLRGNPVLGFENQVGTPGSFDENGLGEPAVWSSGGFWWMLYTGRAANEQRRIGLARSTDGVRWEREPGLLIEGRQPWNAQVVADPTVVLPVVLEEDGSLRVWFGGGDLASPDENLNGQIGLGVLRPTP